LGDIKAAFIEAWSRIGFEAWGVGMMAEGDGAAKGVIITF
jgi:hypothetical protein